LLPEKNLLLEKCSLCSKIASLPVQHKKNHSIAAILRFRSLFQVFILDKLDKLENVIIFFHRHFKKEGSRASIFTECENIKKRNILLILNGLWKLPTRNYQAE